MANIFRCDNYLSFQYVTTVYFPSSKHRKMWFVFENWNCLDNESLKLKLRN